MCLHTYPRLPASILLPVLVVPGSITLSPTTYSKYSGKWFLQLYMRCYIRTIIVRAAWRIFHQLPVFSDKCAACCISAVDSVKRGTTAGMLRFVPFDARCHHVNLSLRSYISGYDPPLFIKTTYLPGLKRMFAFLYSSAITAPTSRSNCPVRGAASYK